MNRFKRIGTLSTGALALLIGCSLLVGCPDYTTKDEPGWKPAQKYTEKDEPGWKPLHKYSEKDEPGWKPLSEYGEGEKDEPTYGIPWGGKVYSVVIIGNQWWLGENLDIGTRTNATDLSAAGIQKWCYDDIEANCAKYGGLYSFKEITDPNNSVCPPGWRVPTYEDWDTLVTAVGDDGNSLKAVGEGDGTNSSKFGALLGGWREEGFGAFKEITERAEFWTSDDVPPSYDTASYVNLRQDDVIDPDGTQKIFRGCSVRCIKD